MQSGQAHKGPITPRRWWRMWLLIVFTSHQPCVCDGHEISLAPVMSDQSNVLQTTCDTMVITFGQSLRHYDDHLAERCGYPLGRGKDPMARVGRQAAYVTVEWNREIRKQMPGKEGDYITAGCNRDITKQMPEIGSSHNSCMKQRGIRKQVY